MNPFSFLIPRLWSAEEALAAIVLLRQIIDAIWEVHGENMAHEALSAPDRWAIDDLLAPEPCPFDDTDLPF